MEKDSSWVSKKDCNFLSMRTWMRLSAAYAPCPMGWMIHLKFDGLSNSCEDWQAVDVWGLPYETLFVEKIWEVYAPVSNWRFILHQEIHAQSHQQVTYRKNMGESNIKLNRSNLEAFWNPNIFSKLIVTITYVQTSLNPAILFWT